MNSNIFMDAIAFISLLVGILALVSPEYRGLIVALFALFLTAYFLLRISSKVESNSESIKKLEEKLSIHNQLIDIKADIELLKKGRR